MAGIYNFIIEKGATFSRVFTWRDENSDLVNLTGYTARMHIRDSRRAGTTILELTSGVEITLGGAAGTITVTIAATATDDLPDGVGYYDLELISSGGVVTRLLQGSITFSPEVTR